jgi:hypothetical protein
MSPRRSQPSSFMCCEIATRPDGVSAIVPKPPVCSGTHCEQLSRGSCTLPTRVHTPPLRYAYAMLRHGYGSGALRFGGHDPLSSQKSFM